MLNSWINHLALPHVAKPLLGFAVFFMVVKLTVARMLVLMACMGYGVVKCVPSGVVCPGSL